jgi:hypothetical protein
MDRSDFAFASRKNCVLLSVYRSDARQSCERKKVAGMGEAKNRSGCQWNHADPLVLTQFDFLSSFVPIPKPTNTYKTAFSREMKNHPISPPSMPALSNAMEPIEGGQRIK